MFQNRPNIVAQMFEYLLTSIPAEEQNNCFKTFQSLLCGHAEMPTTRWFANGNGLTEFIVGLHQEKTV